MSSKKGSTDLATIKANLHKCHPETRENSFHIMASSDSIMSNSLYLLQIMRYAMDKMDASLADSIINGQTKGGDTPLHFAVIKQNAETLRGMVTSGARVNVINVHGKTPLHTLLAFVPRYGQNILIADWIREADELYAKVKALLEPRQPRDRYYKRFANAALPFRTDKDKAGNTIFALALRNRFVTAKLTVYLIEKFGPAMQDFDIQDLNRQSMDIIGVETQLRAHGFL